MDDPYIGEIRLFAGNFAPSGWAMCNGQQLSISENSTLFSLIGTTFGGDGQQTFALPDLQGRVPLHMGEGYELGEKAGVENVTLTAQQLPAHSHSWSASTSAAQNATPVGNAFAAGVATVYSNSNPTTPMNANVVGLTGGGTAHQNRQPYVCLSYIISLVGLFPTRN